MNMDKELDISYSRRKVTIPKEYDTYLIELKPDEYRNIISELKGSGIREEIIKKLDYKQATKDDLVFIFE